MSTQTQYLCFCYELQKKGTLGVSYDITKTLSYLIQDFFRRRFPPRQGISKHCFCNLQLHITNITLTPFFTKHYNQHYILYYHNTILFLSSNKTRLTKKKDHFYFLLFWQYTIWWLWNGPQLFLSPNILFDIASLRYH